MLTAANCTACKKYVENGYLEQLQGLLEQDASCKLSIHELPTMNSAVPTTAPRALRGQKLFFPMFILTTDDIEVPDASSLRVFNATHSENVFKYKGGPASPFKIVAWFTENKHAS